MLLLLVIVQSVIIISFNALSYINERKFFIFVLAQYVKNNHAFSLN